jgi:ABC-type polysaccharide/polyol phosphate export permease
LAIPWFAFAFVKRDVVTVYKQTVLGPLWYLIQPLHFTLHYYFNNLAGIDTELFHFCLILQELRSELFHGV